MSVQISSLFFLAPAVWIIQLIPDNESGPKHVGASSKVTKLEEKKCTHVKTLKGIYCYIRLLECRPLIPLPDSTFYFFYIRQKRWSTISMNCRNAERRFCDIEVVKYSVGQSFGSQVFDIVVVAYSNECRWLDNFANNESLFRNLAFWISLEMIPDRTERYFA